MNRSLQLGLAATALWAASFAIGARTGFALEVLALVSVVVVLATAITVDLRSLLAPRQYIGLDMRPGPGVDCVASVEKLHIQRVLNHTKGNKTETARLLNIGLTTLYRKIEEYKIL